MLCWRSSICVVVCVDGRSNVIVIDGFSRFLFSILEQQPLAPGVTQKDVDLYKEIREKAAKTVAAVTGAITPPVRQVSNLTSPTLVAMAAQERCPAAIDFGPWDIETWYSSPFPQEYARYEFCLHPIQFS